MWLPLEAVNVICPQVLWLRHQMYLWRRPWCVFPFSQDWIAEFPAGLFRCMCICKRKRSSICGVVKASARKGAEGKWLSSHQDGTVYFVLLQSSVINVFCNYFYANGYIKADTTHWALRRDWKRRIGCCMEQEMIQQRQATWQSRVTVVFHLSVKTCVGHNCRTFVDFVPRTSHWRCCWQSTVLAQQGNILSVFWILGHEPKYSNSSCRGGSSNSSSVGIFSFC